MREQKNYLGLASRLLAGAKDLVWQDEPATKRAANLDAAPSRQADDRAAADNHSVSPATNPLAAELMSVVMNRPTAYSSLADAIAALSAIPLDEANRFRSAFAVLQKTQQRSVEQIVQAVDVHLSILESEKARFSAQCGSVEDEEVTSKLKEAEALGSASADADQQIAKLRADTEALVQKIEEDKRARQTRAAELAREAKQKRQSIAQRSSEFATAAGAVQAVLLADKAKLQQYLR